MGSPASQRRGMRVWSCNLVSAGMGCNVSGLGGCWFLYRIDNPRSGPSKSRAGHIVEVANEFPSIVMFHLWLFLGVLESVILKWQGVKTIIMPLGKWQPPKFKRWSGNSIAPIYLKNTSFQQMHLRIFLGKYKSRRVRKKEKKNWQVLLKTKSFGGKKKVWGYDLLPFLEELLSTQKVWSLKNTI